MSDVKICKHCQCEFHSRDKRRKFCGLKCLWDWRRKQPSLPGAFKPGLTPWNSGTVGVMKRNSGSFKKGQPSKTHEEIGAVTIRKDKQGKLRAWVKVSAKGNSYDWQLRAVFTWELEHGIVPKGMVVHHVDRDTLNDSLSNLQLLTRAEHMQEHRDEIRSAAVKRLRQQVFEFEEAT